MIPIWKDHGEDTPWEELYKGWPEIKRFCQQFNMMLAQGNRFILVLGWENFIAVKAYLDADKSIKAARVDLPLKPSVNIYKDSAHYLVPSYQRLKYWENSAMDLLLIPFGILPSRRIQTGWPLP